MERETEYKKANPRNKMGVSADAEEIRDLLLVLAQDGVPGGGFG